MFCEEDSHQLMSSGDEQVVFYHWVSAGRGSSSALDTAIPCSSCSLVLARAMGPEWVGVAHDTWYVSTHVSTQVSTHVSQCVHLSMLCTERGFSSPLHPNSVRQGLQQDAGSSIKLLLPPQHSHCSEHHLRGVGSGLGGGPASNGCTGEEKER